MATRASSQKPGLSHKTEKNHGTVKQNQKLCSGAATQHQTGLKLVELPAADADAARVRSNASQTQKNPVPSTKHGGGRVVQ